MALMGSRPLPHHREDHGYQGLHHYAAIHLYHTKLTNLADL